MYPGRSKDTIHEADTYLAGRGRLDQTIQQVSVAAAAQAGPEAGNELGATAAEHATTSHNGPVDPLDALFDMTDSQRQMLSDDNNLQAVLRQQNLAVVIVQDLDAEATQRALRDIHVRSQDIQEYVDQALARQSGSSGNVQVAHHRLNPRATVFHPGGDFGH